MTPIRRSGSKAKTQIQVVSCVVMYDMVWRMKVGEKSHEFVKFVSVVLLEGVGHEFAPSVLKFRRVKGHSTRYNKHRSGQGRCCSWRTIQYRFGLSVSLLKSYAYSCLVKRHCRWRLDSK
jgi:hypothetical protein